MGHQTIMLPGSVLPKELAYGDLIEALGPEVDVRAKDLEVYATEEPAEGFGLEAEIDGVLREADAAGFERFHLVGYSGGGAVAISLVARYPERVLSLALLEPAWIGNEGLSEAEREGWEEIARITALPPEEMMPRFVAIQLAPGVEPPPPPFDSPPPWMAKRPGGIKALGKAFRRHQLDHGTLRTYAGPVLYALGGRSNPDFFAAMAARLADVFEDFTLEVFEDRHHFDPPHRAEPGRLAVSLRALWERAANPATV